MKTYVSMLRGINVGSQKAVKMDELRRMYESLGFENVRSYVQSGNVVFDSADGRKVADAIRYGVKGNFGFEVSIFVRTTEELQKIVDRMPFAGKDKEKIHVTFLSETPVAFPTKEIEAAKEGAEEFHESGREVYLFCPNGYGRTKLSNNFFERKLKVNATTRNWKTVNALLAMAKTHDQKL